MAKARFSQFEVTKLLRAARGSGFTCVSIQVLPGGLQVNYAERAEDEPKQGQTAFEAWREKMDRERERYVASSFKPDKADRLSQREWNTLEQLYQRRAQEVPRSEIRGAGITTQKSLQAMGYAALTMEGDRIVSWRITGEGENFYRQAMSA